MIPSTSITKNCCRFYRRKLLLSYCVLCLSLGGCCKKHPDYTVSDYAKSWISSYQNTQVTFKNQFDSVVNYIYSNPALEIYNVDQEEGGCTGSTAFTYQDLTMTLSGNDLPVSFGFDLQSSTDFYGDENPEKLTISFPSHCEPMFVLWLPSGLVTIVPSVQYIDSVILNNSVFYSVYSENNECGEDTIDAIHSIYFTKANGIVGFQTDSAMWVLQ